MKYVKRPIPIEAYHLKDLSHKSIVEAWNFMGKPIPESKTLNESNRFDDYMNIVQKQRGIRFKTMEGEETAWEGDYIIKGNHGEFYPCDPIIFEKNYEPVKE